MSRVSWRPTTTLYSTRIWKVLCEYGVVAPRIRRGTLIVSENRNPLDRGGVPGRANVNIDRWLNLLYCHSSKSSRGWWISPANVACARSTLWAIAWVLSMVHCWFFLCGMLQVINFVVIFDLRTGEHVHLQNGPVISHFIWYFDLGCVRLWFERKAMECKLFCQGINGLGVRIVEWLGCLTPRPDQGFGFKPQCPQSTCR